jgi:hypothetical protein
LQAAKDRTAVTVRWAAHDDNGDDLTYALYLRGDGETVWRLLKDKITDKAYSFDATLIPDGGYQVKVVASDAPSHTPGDALTGEKVSERFEVDTTPPVVKCDLSSFLAARYLKAKRRQAVVGVVTTISIAGVAAGVAALIIALAITNGMRRDLQDRLLGSSAHVT